MTPLSLTRFWLRLAQCMLLLAACTPAAAQLNVSKSADLSFGGFVASATSGTVVVAPGGGRSTTGGVVLFGQLLAGVPTVAAAAFNVSGGTANVVCTITLPAETTLTRSGGGSMRASALLSSTGAGLTPSLTLNSSGAASFTVGATLSVAASQATGNYGPADLTVSVNCPNP